MSDYRFERLFELERVIAEAGFSMSVIRGVDEKSSEMPDVLVNLGDSLSVGFFIAPSLSVKPYVLFPENQPMTLGEVKTFMSGFAVSRN